MKILNYWTDWKSGRAQERKTRGSAFSVWKILILTLFFAAPVVLQAQSTFDLATSTGTPSNGGTEWTFDNNVLTVHVGANITISNAVPLGSAIRVVVEGEGVSQERTRVTLNGVTIGGTGSGLGATRSPFALEAGADVILTLTGANTLSVNPGAAGGPNNAGLLVPANSKLQILGTGSLNATGGTGSAGIGGSSGSAGTIIIGNAADQGNNPNRLETAPSVTAQGGGNGPGIGGGQNGTALLIEIWHGTVVATGGTDGAGIGSGVSGTAGVIRILGGHVTATGSVNGAGIGGGRYSDGAELTICDAYVEAIGGTEALGIGRGEGLEVPHGALLVLCNSVLKTTSVPEEFNPDSFQSGIVLIEDEETSGKYVGEVYGDVELIWDLVLGTDDELLIADGNSLKVDSDGQLTNGGQVLLEGDGEILPSNYADLGLVGGTGEVIPMTNLITLDDDKARGIGWKFDLATGVYTILDGADVNIQPSATPAANTRRIEVEEDATAKILFQGGANLAGIIHLNGAATPFTVKEGADVTLTVRGHVSFGATNQLWANNPAIKVEPGAKLTISGNGAASGSTLTAIGGSDAAGIEIGTTIAGNTATAGTVIIGETAGEANNLTVVATGAAGGAGIGSGNSARTDIVHRNHGVIVINSGTVTATGVAGGAGIGGGNGSLGTTGNITINGGTVTANAGTNAAGIGSGQTAVNNGESTNVIQITGGTVEANGNGGGAGIGGGGHTSTSPVNGSVSGVIKIAGGTVEATGGTTGAGIGSGSYAVYNTNPPQDVQLISITGGTVTAEAGGGTAAGIGGGEGSLGNNVSITAGSVTALSPTGMAIGRGVARAPGTAATPEKGTLTIGFAENDPGKTDDRAPLLFVQAVGTLAERANLLPSEDDDDLIKNRGIIFYGNSGSLDEVEVVVFSELDLVDSDGEPMYTTATLALIYNGEIHTSFAGKYQVPLPAGLTIEVPKDVNIGLGGLEKTRFTALSYSQIVANRPTDVAQPNTCPVLNINQDLGCLLARVDLPTNQIFLNATDGLFGNGWVRVPQADGSQIYYIQAVPQTDPDVVVPTDVIVSGTVLSTDVVRRRIVVLPGVQAELTFKDVTMEAAGTDVSPLALSQGAATPAPGTTTNVTLKLEGVNTLTSTGNRPAIQVPNRATLTIAGDELEATVAGTATPAIGLGAAIANASVSATGVITFNNAVALGTATAGDITIEGGRITTVTPTGSTADGIGANIGVNPGTLTIDGATAIVNTSTLRTEFTTGTPAVTNEVLDKVKGILILDTQKSDLWTLTGLTINKEGTVFGNVVLTEDFEVETTTELVIEPGAKLEMATDKELVIDGRVIAYGELEGDYDDENGSLIENPVNLIDFDYVYTDEDYGQGWRRNGDVFYVVHERDFHTTLSVEVNGKTQTQSIIVLETKEDYDANITIDRVEVVFYAPTLIPPVVNMPYSPLTINSGAVANLILKGENILVGGQSTIGGTPGLPGIRVLRETTAATSPRGVLTITGDGSLEATGGNGAAGIGGIHASAAYTPGVFPAGGSLVGDIIIESGEITATGGNYGAGIGTGFNAIVTGEITISGGVVYANAGGTSGAGIGSGGSMLPTDPGGAQTITITGGFVNAVGIGSGSYGIGPGGGSGAGGTLVNIGILDDDGEPVGNGVVYTNTVFYNATVPANLMLRSGIVFSGAPGTGTTTMPSNTAGFVSGTYNEGRIYGKKVTTNADVLIKYGYSLDVAFQGAATAPTGLTASAPPAPILDANGDPVPQILNIGEGTTLTNSGRVKLYYTEGAEINYGKAGFGDWDKTSRTVTAGTPPVTTGYNSWTYVRMTPEINLAVAPEYPSMFGLGWSYMNQFTSGSPASTTFGLFTVTADDPVLAGIAQEVVITGENALNRRIVVNSGAADKNIRLKDAEISFATGVLQSPFSLNSSSVILTLEGENELTANGNFAGVHVPAGSKIVIEAEDEGSLVATGGTGNGSIGGAGIGSQANTAGTVIEFSGEIIINGGIITATGGNNAGIGGSGGGPGGNPGNPVEIRGGIITAFGGNSSAGIGGGPGQQASNGLIIQNAIVTATGGDGGAGIGGGAFPPGTGNTGNGISAGGITITNSSVTATGGINSAGIGGGNNASGSNQPDNASITIDGSVVVAKGLGNALGIGRGDYTGSQSDGNVVVINSFVDASSMGTLDPGSDDYVIFDHSRALEPRDISLTTTANDVDVQVALAKGNLELNHIAVIPADSWLGISASVTAPITATTQLQSLTIRPRARLTNSGYIYINENCAVVTAPTYSGGRLLDIYGSLINPVAANIKFAAGTGCLPEGLNFIKLNAAVADRLDNDPVWSWNQPERTEVTIFGDATNLINVLIEGSTSAVRVIVDENAKNLNLQFSDVTINGSNFGEGISPVTIGDGAEVTIQLSGTNTITGGTRSAAINAPDGTTLTIAGDGVLTANGGPFAAGIGGSFDEDGGDIIIAGGTIYANAGAGSELAHGIGAGPGIPAREPGTLTVDGNTVVFASSVGDEDYNVEKGILFVGPAATASVYGDVTLASLTLPAGYTLNVPDATTLEVTLLVTNNGTINDISAQLGNVTVNSLTPATNGINFENAVDVEGIVVDASEDGSAIDITATLADMFSINPKAGDAVYSITGPGSFTAMFTVADVIREIEVTQCGTFTVTMTTLANDNTFYAAGDAVTNTFEVIGGEAPAIVWPAIATQQYAPGLTLAQVAIPTTTSNDLGTFAWTLPATTLVNVGHTGFSVTFTPNPSCFDYTGMEMTSNRTFTVTPLTITGSVSMSYDDEEAVEEGSVLTLVTTDLLPANAEIDQLKIEWLRDGQPIAGANGLTYTVAAADDMQPISVRVTGEAGTNYLGVLQSTSITIGQDLMIGTIAITYDELEVGEVLTAEFTPIPATAPHTFEWLRGGVVITGATGDEYVITEDDLGAWISVRAVAGEGFTGVVTATPVQIPQQRPSAPQNVAVEAHPQRLVVTWAAPANNGGSDILYYEVSTNGTDWELAHPAAFTYSISGLTNGTEYTVSVRARNEAGVGAIATGTGTPSGTFVPVELITLSTTNFVLTPDAPVATLVLVPRDGVSPATVTPAEHWSASDIVWTLQGSDEPITEVSSDVPDVIYIVARISGGANEGLSDYTHTFTITFRSEGSIDPDANFVTNIVMTSQAQVTASQMPLTLAGTIVTSQPGEEHDYVIVWSGTGVTDGVFSSTTAGANEVTATVIGGGHDNTNVVRTFNITVILPTSDPENALVAELRAWVLQSGMVHITGLVSGERLTIFNTAGSVVYDSTSTSESVDLSINAPGVYIVRAGDRTVRVVVTQ